MSIAFPTLPSADAIRSISTTQVATPLSAALEQGILQDLRSEGINRQLPPLAPSPEAKMPEPDRASVQRSVQDLMGHFRELQHATRSEISQTRAAVEHRLDDLAAALHTDMRRVRSEAHSEVETLGKDLFHCATALSHVQDRLTRLELAFNALAAQLQVQETPSVPPPLNILPIRRTTLEPVSR